MRYYRYHCDSCGLEEERYSNSTRCRRCGKIGLRRVTAPSPRLLAIRDEIAKFVMVMEFQLQHDELKRTWKSEPIIRLLNNLRDEVNDLAHKCPEDRATVLAKTASIALYAMFIADAYGVL